MSARDTRDDPFRLARIDRRRVSAIAATLSVHLALALWLLRIAPLPSLPPTLPIIVHLILEPEQQASAAGAARADPRARLAAAAMPKPRREPTRRTKVAAPRAEVAVITPQAVAPPPPLAPIRLAAAAPAAAPAVGSDSAAPGAGHRGAAASGAGDAVFTTHISFRRAATPVLSSHARVMGQTGYTIVLVRVGVDGRPLEVRVARSSGHPDLDSAAVRAARASDFNPHLRGGKPIEFVGIVPYTFGVADPPIAADLARLGIVVTT